MLRFRPLGPCGPWDPLRDEGPLSLLDPRWDELRPDPRFLELKRRVGL